MDKSQVIAIVKENIGVYMDAFGIPHWKLTVFYDHELGTDVANAMCKGSCSLTTTDYEEAAITLNYANFDDEEDVLKVLRHELLHVVASPTQLYTEAVEQVDISDDAKAVLARIRTNMIERLVLHMERMYGGMCELNISRNKVKKVAKLKRKKVAKK